MAFQPQVQMPGLAGWRILERTQASQKAAFEKGPELARDVEYFAKNIGKVTSAAELVADRRLLKVALGAFGLEADIDKKAFVRKVLEQGTSEPTALARRLTDPAYRAVSAAFGFGDAGGAKVRDPGFAASITDAYKVRAFEAAVGQSNNDMRLAMNFKRSIPELAAGETGGSWFSVIGSKTLSEVVYKGFGLPSSFARLDVDQQRDVLRQRSKDVFGSPDLSVFQDAANVNKMIDRFLARSQIEGSSSAASSASGALTILRNAAAASAGLSNLLASNR